MYTKQCSYLYAWPWYVTKNNIFFYFYKEDYLDLPLILSGCNGLEQSLEMSYVLKENLEGANKYKCGSCGKLVNAIKVCSCMKIFQSKPSLLYVCTNRRGTGEGRDLS